MRNGSSNAERKWWRAGALAWLAVLLLVAFHQVQFWREDRVTLDILALLPVDEQAPELDLVTRKLADGMTRQLVIMLGGSDWDNVQEAAYRFRKTLGRSTVHLREQSMADSSAMLASLDFYRPWRDRLLTTEQRHRLASVPAESLTQQALTSLYQPGISTRMSDWSADPLGLWEQWWAARAEESPARPRDGLLWLENSGMHWAVLFYETPGSAFSLSGAAVYADTLERAWEEARAGHPNLQWLRAGVPLHAEAGAVQANREMSTIGLGSLAGVILLVWLAFRSLRSIVLVALSLIIACAVALSATAWVFGDVHLITLIFGASLVGVAEDYGIHYFAARQSEPWVKPQPLMRKLLPALLVALVTSVIAYLALGVAPFPGLRQMAFFSATGLIAALLTVVLWFPFLDRGAAAKSPFGSWLGGTLTRWPRLSGTVVAWLAYGTLAIGAVLGIAKIETRDDVRQLQSSPPQLIAEQRQIADLLNLPSPAQFYLIHGPSTEAVLQREEALKNRLDVLKATGRIGGYSAVSDWVPSIAQQTQNAALTLSAETAVLQGVGTVLGESLVRPAFDATALTVPHWLSQTAGDLGKSLWLGDTGDSVMSVVMLRGLTDVALLPELAQAAQGLEGVRWIDRPGEFSSLLERYRWSMTWLLVVGHILVFAVVSWRFGRIAWRAWVPTVLATIGVIAVLGWLGEPWQLFNILALALLLGVGVDYGIFLLEHDNDASAWLAVVIGAGSTWLSFGLLGLSNVPALRAFGLTLMIGLVIVLILAPVFRVASSPDMRLAARAKHDARERLRSTATT